MRSEGLVLYLTLGDKPRMCERLVRLLVLSIADCMLVRAAAVGKHADPPTREKKTAEQNHMVQPGQFFFYFWTCLHLGFMSQQEGPFEKQKLL